MVTIPSSAAITIAAIAIAIINTSVKTYMGAPVSHVETVRPAFITPIGRSP